ncbi:MAG: hypothetical protein RXQ22_08880 [Sulfolobus sp.]
MFRDVLGVGITGLLLVLENICNFIDLIDINPKVSNYVLYNIKTASLESKAKLIISDLLEEIPHNKYNLIIGNPLEFLILLKWNLRSI